MATPAAHPQPQAEKSLLLLNLADKAIQARNLQELAEPFLAGLVTLTGAPAAFLSLVKTPLPMDTFFQVGLPPEAVPVVAQLCDQRLCQLSPQTVPAPASVTVPPNDTVWIIFYLISRQQRPVGLLGLLYKALAAPEAQEIKKALNFFIWALNKLIDQIEVCGERIRAEKGGGVRLLAPPRGRPRARDVGLLGLRLLERGEGVDPADLVPRYIRRAEAEVRRTGLRTEPAGGRRP